MTRAESFGTNRNKPDRNGSKGIQPEQTGINWNGLEKDYFEWYKTEKLVYSRIRNSFPIFANMKNIKIYSIISMSAGMSATLKI